ncbi:MAG: hypothetical protein P8L79_06495 [Rhodospirillaceae bacterium]|nr:hypothetical protein [Rhodospirillaceae bacterium]
MSPNTKQNSRHTRIRRALNVDVVKSVPLSGRCIGDVRLYELADDRRVAAKTGAPPSTWKAGC